MSEQAFDYGPLQGLIGTWAGDRGMDVAPEPDGTENSPYYETITFADIGDVTNAEEQTLTILRYHQVVARKSNDEVFHDETGYWMWDAATNTVMQSLAIPRAVTLLAGGVHSGNVDASVGPVTIDVAAGIDDPDWQIIQSPFMKEKARTTGFKHQMVVEGDTLRYSETTMLDIYGRTFEHTDDNVLTRQP